MANRTESHAFRKFQPVELWDYFGERDISSNEWAEEKEREYAMLNSTSGISTQIFNQLPNNIIERIVPQLSFTALRRLYNTSWPDYLDVSKYRTFLACIKNEEDIYRFLYFHNASHPLLQHDITMNVLENRGLLIYEDIPNDDPLICRATNKADKGLPDFRVARGDVVVADKTTFEEQWKVYTQDMFAHMDWSNVFVAGGSVLHCLRQMKHGARFKDLADLFKNFYGESDIDLYIYGLDEEATKAKVLDIYNSVNKVFKELYVIKSKNAFTLFSDGMRPLQVIATMYKSVDEILLSFDLGCIMVGYNGKDVLCLPRFLVSMKYMTNHLDSDMNLSNKLQWFRLQKYAIRGFNSALPTSFRFHGLNGFDKAFPSPEDIRTLNVDTSLKKVVEIMSLSKMSLLEKTLPQFWMNFPYLWSIRWHQGFSFNLSRSSLDEERALENWGVDDVTGELRNLELHHLTSEQVGSFWLEPPAYPDTVPVWTMSAHPEYHKAADAYKYGDGDKADSAASLHTLLKEFEITSFTESILQCYYLDSIVECKTCNRTTQVNNDQNPYRLMNSSLSTIDYVVESGEFELSNLTHSTVGTIESEVLSLGGSYWRVTLEIPKKGDLLWLKLLKLNDVVDTEAKKQLKYYFVNFVLTLKSTKKKAERYDMHFDGSFIFKNEEGRDTWKTFIYRPYVFKPTEFDIDPLDMPRLVGNLVQSDISFLHGGSILGKLTMQFHAPRLEVINI